VTADIAAPPPLFHRAGSLENSLAQDAHIHLGLTLPFSTLPERLARRAAVEAEAARSGRTFRRHPERSSVENSVVKPLLRLGLRATGLYSRGSKNALAVRVTQRELEFPDLPREFDGFRILHLSDLHIDSLPGLPGAVASALRGLDVDVCVMTGDYRVGVEGPCDAALEGMREVLAALPECPVIGTLGNHDPCEIAAGLEELGVELLINESTHLWRGGSSLSFAGTDDPYDYRTDDLPASLSGVPKGTFKVLLTHTPDLYAEAAGAGVRLYLCGHTHAGQVRLPLVGSILQNSTAPRSYTHGAWRHAGMQGYTSAGIGCSMLPIRFNCPPEIAIFQLTRSIGRKAFARTRRRRSAVRVGLPRRLPA
jgi:uncharacterized protein